MKNDMLIAPTCMYMFAWWKISRCYISTWITKKISPFSLGRKYETNNNKTIWLHIYMLMNYPPLLLRKIALYSSLWSPNAIVKDKYNKMYCASNACKCL